MQQLNNDPGYGYLYTNPYYREAGSYPASLYPQPYYNFQQTYMNPPVTEVIESDGTRTLQFDSAKYVGNNQTIGMGMNANDMQQKFSYQNDPVWQNYNSNPFSTNYYGQYGQQYTTTPGYGYYGAFAPQYMQREEGYYNPYWSKTFMSSVGLDDQSNRRAMSPYYAAVYQQQEYQKVMDAHNQTMAMLRKNFCHDCDTSYEEELERINKENEKRYVKYQEDMQTAQLMSYTRQAVFVCNATTDYVNPIKNSYVARWNRLYEEYHKDIPENYTMEEFFNGGVGDDMYRKMIISSAKRREQNLNRLYSATTFDEQMRKLHPELPASQSPIAARKRWGMPLTIDDMEMKVPNATRPIISPPKDLNEVPEYKRYDAFMSNILSGLRR